MEKCGKLCWCVCVCKRESEWSSIAHRRYTKSNLRHSSSQKNVVDFTWFFLWGVGFERESGALNLVECISFVSVLTRVRRCIVPFRFSCFVLIIVHRSHIRGWSISFWEVQLLNFGKFNNQIWSQIVILIATNLRIDSRKVAVQIVQINFMTIAT